jgi:hypothetical protein
VLDCFRHGSSWWQWVHRSDGSSIWESVEWVIKSVGCVVIRSWTIGMLDIVTILSLMHCFVCGLHVMLDYQFNRFCGYNLPNFVWNIPGSRNNWRYPASDTWDIVTCQRHCHNRLQSMFSNQTWWTRRWAQESRGDCKRGAREPAVFGFLQWFITWGPMFSIRIAEVLVFFPGPTMAPLGHKTRSKEHCTDSDWIYRYISRAHINLAQ